MANKIQVRRGAIANLPTLSLGEPALTTDTNRMFIGSNGGNVELATVAWAKDTFSNPNLLINGDFQVWQRGTSGLVNGYTADRWQIAGGNGTVSQIQVTDLIGAEYGLKVICGIEDWSFLTQPLENYKNLVGKTVTLSGYCKPIGGVTEIYHNIGYNGADNIKSTKLTAGQWTRFVHTVEFTVDMNNTGALFTAPYKSTAGQGYQLALVKLEIGSVATPFVPRSYGEELVLCKRYGELIEEIRGIYCDIAGNIFCPINFSEKRIVPTITKFSGWGADTEGYVHYQPIGIGGTNHLSSVNSTTKTTAQLIMTTRGDITVTPAVGSFIITNVFIDAEL